MTKQLFFIFFLVACGSTSLLLASDEHDIHLSLCELRYNESTSSFEVSIKIFIDDLEKAIEKEGGKNLFIGTERESPIAEEHIGAYLDKYFTITVDGIRLKASYLGKQLADDNIAVWCYVEFSKDVSSAKSCILSNRILLDVYDDQRNIMDIKMSKSHKDYTIFESDKSSWSYRF